MTTSNTAAPNASVDQSQSQSQSEPQSKDSADTATKMNTSVTTATTLSNQNEEQQQSTPPASTPTPTPATDTDTDTPVDTSTNAPSSANKSASESASTQPMKNPWTKPQPQPLPSQPKSILRSPKNGTVTDSVSSLGLGLATTLTETSSSSSVPQPPKLSFEAIMKEQEEQEKEKELVDIYLNNAKKKKVTIIDTKVLDEEEEMIRLAIEASLKDTSTSASASASASASGFNLNQDQDLKQPSNMKSDNNNFKFNYKYNDYHYTCDNHHDSTSSFVAVADMENYNDDINVGFDDFHGDDINVDIGVGVGVGVGLDNDNDHHDKNSITISGGGDDDDDDSMDEDMKLAIRLSLQENGNGNNNNMDMNMNMKLGVWQEEAPPLPKAIITSSLSPLTTVQVPTSVSASASASASEASSLKTPYYDASNDYHDDDDEEKKRNSQLDDLKLPPTKPSPPASPIATKAAAVSVAASASTTATSAIPSSSSSFLTKEEEEQIAHAIMVADDEAMAKSIQLAMELNAEEKRKAGNMSSNRNNNKKNGNDHNQSNINVVSQYEFENYKKGSKRGGEMDNSSNNSMVQDRKLWGKDDYESHEQYYNHNDMGNDNIVGGGGDDDDNNDGFQMNSSTPSSKWSRIDKNTIIGPNNEIRTKHDITLKNQANADKLLSSSKGMKRGKLAVSDMAYNSFHRSLKNSMKRSTVKGVAAYGTGRAENMNAEKTRGGAMDGNVRLLISKAITNGLIQYCNGVIKEGKEAIVYHADGNTDIDSESAGFDVAVKVFKRIQEFKGRGAYIDNDPRYYGKKFKNADRREQVELWTEKEYRNLIRANKAGVPVPTPLMQKENVLFMRFLGEGGWPAPQLREVELKKRSKKWTALYMQIMTALRRLYHIAQLVHADLSEYNILVSPMSQVENALDQSEEAKDSLQIVLIDFGQAVQIRHPSAGDLLRRDLTMVRAFFDKQGIATLSVDESEEFVLKEIDDDLEEIVDDESEEGSNNEEIKDNNETETEDCANEEENKDSNDEVVCRFAIPEGWDDTKDMEWLESKLLEISSKVAA